MNTKQLPAIIGEAFLEAIRQAVREEIAVLVGNSAKASESGKGLFLRSCRRLKFLAWALRRFGWQFAGGNCERKGLGGGCWLSEVTWKGSWRRTRSKRNKVNNSGY